jgi:hypothetical protein
MELTLLPDGVERAEVINEKSPVIVPGFMGEGIRPLSGEFISLLQEMVSLGRSYCPEKLVITEDDHQADGCMVDKGSGGCQGVELTDDFRLVFHFVPLVFFY